MDLIIIIRKYNGTTVVVNSSNDDVYDHEDFDDADNDDGGSYINYDNDNFDRKW